VTCVACPAAGDVVVSTGGDGSVRLWDLDTGKERRRLGNRARPALAVAVSRDGRRVASGSWDQKVRVWDSDGTPRGTAGHGAWVTAVAWSPDGKRLVTGAEEIFVWDATTGRDIRRYPGHEQTIFALAFSPDGKVLASVGGDGLIHLRDMTTGRELPPLRGHVRRVFSVAWAPDGKTLASCGEDEVIRLWDPFTGEVRRRLPGHVGGAHRVVFSPDGKTLASTGVDRAVRLWDVAGGKELRRCDGHQEVVYALAFSPDGKHLASRSGDLALLLWDVETGREVRRFGTGALEDVIKEDLGEPMPGARRGAGAQDGPYTLAFSPDGKTLATGGHGHDAVRIWEVSTGGVRARFAGHGGYVRALAFAPDGRRVATGSEDTTALVWDVTGWGRQSPPQPPGADELEKLRADLSGEASRAHRAIWRMVAAPRQSVPLLRAHLRPPPAVEPRRVARLIAHLDSERFAVRESAMRELAEMGESVDGPLRQALAGRPALEVRRRIEQILSRLEQTVLSARARAFRLRALEVLEQIGDREARQVLESLAAGAPEARLTQEAKASLGRLKGRP
jgi:WD40 repeat protein